VWPIFDWYSNMPLFVYRIRDVILECWIVSYVHLHTNPFLLRELTLKHWSLKQSKRGSRELILPSSWTSVLFLVSGALVLAGLYCLCSTSCRPTVCTRNSNIFSPLKYVYKYTIQKDNSILLWIHFYSLNINLHGFQTHHEIKWTTKSK